jgi:hypothetical protein
MRSLNTPNLELYSTANYVITATLAIAIVACVVDPIAEGDETDGSFVGTDTRTAESDDSSGDGDSDDMTSGDGDGDGDPGDGDGETESCRFPLAPCPNDMDCGIDGCLGLWAGTDAWSIMSSADLTSFPTVNPSKLWPCEPDPDVDLCVTFDQQGHIACVRFAGAFAIVVAPACAVGIGSLIDWIDVGNGMCVATAE